jgi:hypothetical protein
MPFGPELCKLHFSYKRRAVAFRSITCFTDEDSGLPVTLQRHEALREIADDFIAVGGI